MKRYRFEVTKTVEIIIEAMNKEEARTCIVDDLVIDLWDGGKRIISDGEEVK